MPRHKNQSQALFSELVNNLPAIPARNIRDAIVFAEYPLAIFGSRQSTKGIYEATLYRDDSGLEITVTGNKDKGIEVFYGWDFDYFYGLVSMLHDEHQAGPRALLLPVEHWVERVYRQPTGPAYKRAYRFLEKARHVYITELYSVVDEKGAVRLMKRVFPPIVEDYAILGGFPRRGRKSLLDETKNGYCRVVFSEWAINHLLHEELSTPLNFDFMMRIPTPLGRRYFRLINCMRNREGADKITRYLLDVGVRIPLKSRYPSEIKRNLDPLHDALLRLNYLTDVEYGWDGRIPLITWCLSKFDTDQALAIQELVSRGVALLIAEKLASSKPVKFVLDVARLFDIYKKEKKVSGAGWIIKIIETAEPSSIEQSLESYDEATRKRRANSAAAVRAKENMRDFYDREIAEKIAEAKKNLTPAEMCGYEARAKEIVPANTMEIGESAYRLSLESVTDYLIKEDLKLPSFEAWCEQRKVINGTN